MGFVFRRPAGLVSALVLTMATLVAPLVTPPVPASAATVRPPAVSQLKLIRHTDHSLAISFAVPAAYYHPGAGVVVRITRGHTPAATPTAGYAVQAPVYPHEAQAGPNPALGADLAYTFAVWIRDNGVYSSRQTLTARTLKDASPPDDVTGVEARATLVDGMPRVVLSWKNPCCDEVSTIRIVRNTEPTTTGGTVVDVPAANQAWADDNLPDSIVNNPDPFDYTTDPLYYWVLARDRAGHWSRSYASTDVVVASRTISGHVSGTDRFVVVYCCPGPTGELSGVTSKGALDGSFTVHLPPGRFTICSGDNHPAGDDPTAACWVAEPDGTGHTIPWSGYNDDVPTASIDLDSAKSYDAVRF